MAGFYRLPSLEVGDRAGHAADAGQGPDAQSQAVRAARQDRIGALVARLTVRAQRRPSRWALSMSCRAI